MNELPELPPNHYWRIRKVPFWDAVVIELVHREFLFFETTLYSVRLDDSDLEASAEQASGYIMRKWDEYRETNHVYEKIAGNYPPKKWSER